MLNDMLETLREYAGDDDSEFMLDLLDSYQGNAPELLAAIAAALSRGDASQMGNAAHSLKSSSAMIGCFAFSALCADLEKGCKNDADPATLAALAGKLQQDYPAIEAAIEALTQQLKNPAPPTPSQRSGFGLSA